MSTIPINVTEVICVILAQVVLFTWFRLGLHRLPRRPDDALTIPPEYLFLLLAGMLFAPLVGVQLLTMLDPQLAGAVEATRSGGAETMGLSDQVRVTLAAVAGQFLVGVVYLYLLSHRAGATWNQGTQPTWRWSRSRAATIALLSFPAVFLLMMLMNVIMTIVLWMIGDAPPPQIAHSTLESIVVADDPFWQAMMVVTVVAIVPVAEEFMYRGLLQELLSRLRLGHWPAILATSIAFAAAHWGAADWHVLPSLFVLSLALGWLYAKSGRLLAPIVLHATFNAANVALGLLLPTH